MTLQLKHENTVTNEWHEIQIGLVYVIDGNKKTLRLYLKQILRHYLNFHSPIEKEEGKEVSEIKLFQLMHSNEKNGWVNEAKAKYDEMVELKTTSSQEGSEPLLEREICERVLGK
ncbi:formin-like protein 4 isoform X2 [Cucumis melo var. makuwa]|uniref:Formin-like protein 4 isoform X2 n=1 Tax=Cucumis melo var. makuwa TaxID=1194695 RepID=A0A5A7ULD8_CUCMM|nr:formin-like protein 4 isoform X2 [Cucumis melo var. makuwa]TYK14979.1 formin-like protein 4 isoform X2 [Cucumis melo var. makuwa]